LWADASGGSSDNNYVVLGHNTRDQHGTDAAESFSFVLSRPLIVSTFQVLVSVWFARRLFSCWWATCLFLASLSTRLFCSSVSCDCLLPQVVDLPVFIGCLVVPVFGSSRVSHESNVW
jgi:hypothetical protein